MSHSDVVMPRHLYGASITSSQIQSPSSSSSVKKGSSPPKSSSSVTSNVDIDRRFKSVALHRKVCISTLDTFHNTATQIAKATERLIRCDIAGQRSSDGNDSSGVTLRSELIGGASHDELAKMVRELGELRKSLDLCIAKK
jgi:hypothetical protein